MSGLPVFGADQLKGDKGNIAVTNINENVR